MDRNRIIAAIGKNSITAQGRKTVFRVTDELGRGGNGVAFIVKSPHRELVAKFYVPPDTRDLDEAAVKRFHREVQLASQINHPFILPVEGAGTLQVGAYRVPFYLMPRAKATFRQLIPKSFDITGLGDTLRTLTRAIQGVSYLHHLGIIHRDIKPENILLFHNNIPRIADLGIAHVASGFVKWSHLTVPKDRLMNWDYYAPEQRYGDATKVDYRADIYALGCILYELISGVPATRPNLPPLKEFDRDFVHLDRIFSRMTAHSPLKRYKSLDLVIDDLMWALVHLGIPTAPPSTEEEDKKTLVRLIRSTNVANQAKAVESAMRLGGQALSVLHEEIGHRRLDVAIAAYKILGEMTHEDSLPYLQAGLYPRRTSKNLYFPTGQYAASALQKYPTEIKLKVIATLSDKVKPRDLALLLNGLSPSKIYPHIFRLYKDELLYHGWGEQPGLSLLLRIDENKSWSIVETMMSRNEGLYSFMVFKDIFPFVNKPRQKILINYLLDRPQSLSSWELPRILDTLIKAKLSQQYVLATIKKIRRISESVFKRYAERENFLKKLAQIQTEILGKSH